MDEEEKQETRAKVECPRCHQTTWHEVEQRVVDTDADDGGWSVTQEFQIIRCLGCDEYSFREVYQDATMDKPSETLWPPRLKKRQTLKGWLSLPPKLRQVYRETDFAIDNSQPVLAAVGIRALIEAVCSHKRAKGKNLKQRIDNLVLRGVLTKGQARVLHRTRFLGNQAAHEARPVERNVLYAAMAIAENMLTSVYLLPQIAKGMRKKQHGTAKASPSQ